LGDVSGEAMKLYESGSTRLLVSICRELARCSPERIFYLSVRKAGELIKVSHTQAGRLFEMLCADELLEVQIQGSQKTQKATRFRYLGSMEDVIA